MKIINLILFSFCCINFGYNQVKSTVNGYVYDKQTGEVLIGAKVYNSVNYNGTLTNQFGFYSITTSYQDSLIIIASFIGYQSKKFIVNLTSQKRYDFYLEPLSKILDEVVVTGERKNNVVESNETSTIRLNTKEIKKMPNLFGEVDIIKAYQLTPGVQSGGEAKSSLYVRGGSPDQNLILLDGVPLYYVSHFGGFLSVFNADAINDVKLIKGGFPAHYGSRISSVLDVSLKEGNYKKTTVQGTIGLLSSKVSVESPIIKDKMSFIISARAKLFPIFKLFDNGLSYNFYDLNAKINYRINKKNNFYFSFYRGNDKLITKNKSEFSKFKSTVSWGNNLLSFRWNHLFSSKLFSNVSVYHTIYKNNKLFNLKQKKQIHTTTTNNTLNTSINDLSLKFDFSYLPNNMINFKFGGQSIYHTFTPKSIKYKEKNDSITKPITQNYSNTLQALESAVYLENIINFKKIKFNIGGRFSFYNTQKITYSAFEPRFLINYLITKRLSIKYSFSRMKQYIHLLTFSGVGAPSDYWMPTTKAVLPENSIQHTFGVYKVFKKGKYELSIESYYKTLSNLIAFKPGASLTDNFDNWETNVEKGGNGVNYGVELFLQKKTGKATGWISFAISDSKRKFKTINNGEYFPFKYNRLLSFSFVGIYQIKKNISLSSTWTYGSGYPVTLATEHYIINGSDVLVFSKKNAYQMRDYHRLDIAVNFTKQKKRGERTFTFSVFNVYNRQNPYYYYYGKEILTDVPLNSQGGLQETMVSELKLFQRSLFSIFPSFAYSFKF